MEGVVFIDGQFVAPEEARISVFDAGLVDGDAVYDVVSVWKGWFFKLDEHLARFERSCGGFRLVSPYSTEEIRCILAECVVRAGLDDAYVKLQLTRGVSPGFTRDPRRAESRFMAYAVPYLRLWGEERSRAGASILVSRFERISSRAVDQRFKNYNRADMVQARLEAYDADADDAVLLGPDGCLSEGFGWNVCIVRDGVVATPDRNVLEGVTRRAVAELCAREGLVLQVRPVRPEELALASEVFATSTAGGVMPITCVDGAAVGDGRPGPITDRLRSLYWSEREAGWCGTRVEELAPAAATAG